MRIPCPPLKLPIWWVNAHRIRISSTLVDCGRWWGWWKDLAFTHPNAVSFSCSSRLVAVLRWLRSWVVGICLALLLWEIIRFYYIIQYSFYFGGGEFCSCVSGGGWRITISWSPDSRRCRALEYCVKMCSSRMMLGKGEHETRIQSRNIHVMQGGFEWVRRIKKGKVFQSIYAVFAPLPPPLPCSSSSSIYSISSRGRHWLLVLCSFIFVSVYNALCCVCKHGDILLSHKVTPGP